MEVRVIKASEPSKNNKINIPLAAAIGGVSGYALKHALPVTIEDLNEFTNHQYQKMIEEKTTKTRNKFLKSVEKEAKRAPENKALDIFIKSQSEDKEIAKQALKERKNLPKEALKQLTEIRNNLASKIKVARQTTTFLLSSSAKQARPASIFVVPGVILGMVFAFIYNVIGDMRNG